MTGWRWVAILCVAVALAGCARTGVKETVATRGGLVGTWTGEATPVVNWVKARHISVILTVHPDGDVSGTVGDAAIVKGEVRRGRGSIRKWLGWGRDYIIEAKLSGFLISAEGIRRDSVMIPFDAKDGALRGGLASSGWEVGDRRTMKLTAKGMVLRRQAPAQ